jgi:hypothetical protein
MRSSSTVLQEAGIESTAHLPTKLPVGLHRPRMPGAVQKPQENEARAAGASASRDQRQPRGCSCRASNLTADRPPNARVERKSESRSVQRASSGTAVSSARVGTPGGPASTVVASSARIAEHPRPTLPSARRTCTSAVGRGQPIRGMRHLNRPSSDDGLVASPIAACNLRWHGRPCGPRERPPAIGADVAGPSTAPGGAPPSYTSRSAA